MTYTREYSLLVIDKASVIFKANVTTPNKGKALTSVLVKVGVTGCRTTTTIRYRIVITIVLTIKFLAIREPK